MGTALNTGRPECAVTTKTYDPLDRPNMVTDPEGRISQAVYFESGDVARVMCAVGTPLEQAYQAYTYVPYGTAGAGQAATVADAKNNTTRYSYDQFDRLGKTEFPHKTSVGSVNINDFESYGYDGNDNQIWKRTRKGDWIENEYDALNRVKAKIVRRGSQTGPVENTVNYTYDLLGRDRLVRQLGGLNAAEIAIPGHNIYTVYDTAERIDYIEHGVTAVANSNSQLGFNISGGRKVDIWHYAAGHRNLIQYPGEGSTGAKTVTFDYDAAGRMTTVVDGSTTLATYSYDALSRKTLLSYLNGAASGYSYHHDSAIAEIEQGFTHVPHNVRYQFGYNKANQVNERAITNIAYVFDGFAPEGTTDYDSNGLNQYTDTEEAPLLPNGQPDPNPASETVTATSYQYDANGNLTYTGSWDYLYDAENRLVQARDIVNSSMVRSVMMARAVAFLSWWTIAILAPSVQIKHTSISMRVMSLFKTT